MNFSVKFKLEVKPESKMIKTNVMKIIKSSSLLFISVLGYLTCLFKRLKKAKMKTILGNNIYSNGS